MSPSLPTIYTITVMTPDHGSISPGGDVAVVAGADKTFTITANGGYAILDVQVDGVSVGSGSAYTFTSVAGDHNISATFTASASPYMRPDAMVNRILDAVVTTLEEIDGTSTRWLTTPKTVTRHTSNPGTESLPLLVVTATQWGPNDPMTSGIHRSSAVIEVRCITKFDSSVGVDDPHRALHRLAADVMSAMESNWQLGGVLDRGYIHVIDGYTANKELDSVAGIAECAVGFKAEWSWDKTAP